jgi:glycosyltransferase involved in cell wall biosynthesis
MKISVVVPAYNEEKYLGPCLGALTGQIEAADEILVVNNNSTDKTAEITKRFNVGLVNEKTQGMIPARNRGFNEAKYEIIARVDADVIVPYNWIKKIKENFRKKNIDALTGPVRYSDSALIINSPIPSKVYLESLRIVNKGKRFLVGPNMSLTKSIWEKVKNKVNVNDSQVHEDLDLSLKIISAEGKIGYDPDLIVSSSARRIVGKPKSFFIEYPAKVVKTFLENK